MATNNHKTLGRNIVPLNYQLKFEPNFKTFKFKCTAVIKIRVARPTNEIKLNANALEVLSASAKIGNKSVNSDVKADKKNEQIILHFPEQLSGAAELCIESEGINNDELVGFYRSKYSNGSKTEYLLTTQFEPAGARQAFACFDEPEFKATFDISFVIDKKLSAISNMPVKSEEPVDGRRKLVKFYTTPNMSSYLLYLAVGRFESISSKLGKIKINVMTVPGKIKYAKMPMTFAKKFLSFYIDYFGVGYPLPKLDFIGIPDFAAGAMENWGAITFREVDLLGDEKSTSVAMKQRIASVVAHELVHMWFGDLVTMKWWDDLWLNESFATFMSYKALDDAYPEWETKTQNVLDMQAVALAADQLNSTHPISVSVDEPGEIDKIFDEISYEKGGSFLGMLEDYVGEKNFRKGLHQYLKSHKYGNATKFDLWDAVGKAAGSKSSDVKTIARYWIDQPGYPMIDMRETSGGFSIEQKRYLLLEKGRHDQVWPIPLHYSVGGKPGFDILRSKAKTLHTGSADYVKLNLGQKGIYRVRYPSKTLEKIGKAIKTKKLGAIDAWGVENDLYSFAKSCRIPLQVYLDFIENYCMDSDYPLNLNVSSHLNSLAMFLYNERSYERVRKLLLRFNRLLLGKLGWERGKDERSVLTMLRAGVISSLGIHGDDEVRKIAKNLFSDKVSKNKEIDPNLRSAVYRINAWIGDEKTFDTLKAMYNREHMPEEKIRLLGSISAFSDAGILASALEFSLSKEVRCQDALSIPGNMAMNPVGKELLWEWTRKNWKILAKRNAAGGHMLKGYVGNIETTCSGKALESFRLFFSDKKNRRSDIELAIEQAIEMMEVNTRFVKNNSAI
jgi:tricorn protease interacting factor F2/3